MSDLQKEKKEKKEKKIIYGQGKERTTKMLLELTSVRRLGAMYRKELFMGSIRNPVSSLSASF